jgi:hypothetical protein
MLHKGKTLKGYKLDSIDGEIGKVKEFYFDDIHWAIRYLVIDTQNWWQGKKVLISPKWIERVSWNESKVFINLSRKAIMESPEFSEMSMLNREYESALFRHYNYQGYWIDEPFAKEHSS